MDFGATPHTRVQERSRRRSGVRTEEKSATVALHLLLLQLLRRCRQPTPSAYAHQGCAADCLPTQSAGHHTWYAYAVLVPPGSMIRCPKYGTQSYSASSCQPNRYVPAHLAQQLSKINSISGQVARHVRARLDLL